MINLCDPLFVSSKIPVDSFFITVVLVFILNNCLCNGYRYLVMYLLFSSSLTLSISDWGRKQSV